MMCNPHFYAHLDAYSLFMETLNINVNIFLHGNAPKCIWPYNSRHVRTLTDATNQLAKCSAADCRRMRAGASCTSALMPMISCWLKADHIHTALECLRTVLQKNRLRWFGQRKDEEDWVKTCVKDVKLNVCTDSCSLPANCLLIHSGYLHPLWSVFSMTTLVGQCK